MATIWWLLPFLLFTVSHGAIPHGYSLSFQDNNAVAGMSKATVDWSDPGMRDLASSTSFSISGWFKWEAGVVLGSPFCWRFSDDYVIDLNYIRGAVLGQVTSWELPANQPGSKVQPREVWNHLVIVVDDGVITTFMNGTLGNSIDAIQAKSWSHPYTLQEHGESYFLFGANPKFSVPLTSHLSIDDNNVGATHESFKGKIDDFTLWSKALNMSEVDKLMQHSMSFEELPDEVVLHYNFDVIGCTNTSKTLFSDDDCAITGSRKIKNYGKAGSDYDLIVGGVNNDYGTGEQYTSSTELVSTDNVKRYIFGTPTVSLDIPSFPNNASTIQSQSNISRAVRVTKSSCARIDIPTGYHSVAVAKVPIQGTLLRGSNNESLSESDNVSNETFLLYQAPNTSNIEDPIMSELLLLWNNSFYYQQLHFWPYTKPMLARDSPTVSNHIHEATLKQRKYAMIWCKPFAYSLSGEQLDMKIVEHPKHAVMPLRDVHHMEVIIAGGRYINIEDKVMNENLIADESGLILLYVPKEDFFGFDEIKVAFISRESGMQSEVFTINLVVKPVDEVPVISGRRDWVVSEDDKNGVNISFDVFDDKKTFGVLAAITRLPNKGAIYSETGALIENPYNIYDRGNPFEQYASRIRKVSSHSSFENLMGIQTTIGHPMQALGPPDCLEDSDQRCMSVNNEFDDLASNLGGIYFVNIYEKLSPLYDSTKGALYQPAKLLSVQESTGLATFELLPTYKVQGPKLVRCILVVDANGEIRYPDTCNVELAASVDYPIIIPGVRPDTVMQTHGRGWSPIRFSDHIFADVGILGEEYAFHHNPASTYQSSDFFPFSEFIEVEFETAVFPVGVEVGFPSGGGSITSVKAETPNGEWINLYRGDPQKDLLLKTNREDQIFYFQENICMQNFQTKALRIELDTSTETGITSNILLDYIKLVGSPHLQNAVVLAGFNSITYIPDEHMFGEDTFEVQAWDCGGSSQRASEPVKFEIEILPLPDSPKMLIENKDNTFAVCNKNTYEGGSTVHLNITILEYDQEEVTCVIDKHPKLGIILQNETLIQSNATLLLSDIEPGVMMLQLEYRLTYACGNQHHISETSVDEFDIMVRDVSGMISNEKIRIKVIKENRMLSGSSWFINKTFFITSICFCFIAIIFVIKYRNHSIIKAARIHILFTVMLGIVISMSGLLLYETSDGEDGSNKKNADYACFSLPIVYSYSFLIKIFPLYAKQRSLVTKYLQSIKIQARKKEKGSANSTFKEKIKDTWKSNMAAFSPSSTNLKKRKKFLARVSATNLRVSDSDLSDAEVYTRPVVKILAYVLMCNTAVLIAGAVILPLEYIRYPIRQSEIKEGFVLRSIGTCANEDDNYLYFMALILAVHMGFLCHMAYICLVTFHITDKFHELKYIRACCLTSFQIMFYTLPTLISTVRTPTAENKVAYVIQEFGTELVERRKTIFRTSRLHSKVHVAAEKFRRNSHVTNKSEPPKLVNHLHEVRDRLDPEKSMREISES